MVKSVKVFTVLILLIIGNVVCAEVYKWIDANGKVHFSQTPPDKSAEKVEIRDDRLEVDEENNHSGIEKEKEYLEYLKQERLDRAENKAKENQKKEKLEERCKKKLANYQDLNAGGRYYELDAQGERIFLSNDQFDKTKKELKKFLDNYCK